MHFCYVGHFGAVLYRSDWLTYLHKQLATFANFRGMDINLQQPIDRM